MIGQTITRLFGLLLLLAVALYSGADPFYEQLKRLAQQRYGEDAVKTIEQWQRMITDSSTLPEKRKLVAANDFFNLKVAFKNDIEVWNSKDYWATPLQTMGRKQGDCEDFSIAKYATLLRLGVPLEKLRITYVKANHNGQVLAHMVLAYYETPRAEPLILDNININILPASQRKDLTPVFGFNSAGLWIGGQTRAATNQPSSRLSRWRDLLTRMHEDGM